MLPLILAAAAGGLVLLAGRKVDVPGEGGGDGKAPAAGASGTVPKVKPKSRKMTPQESFLEGEKVGRSKLEAELAAKAAEDARIDGIVTAKLKSAAKAAPASTTPAAVAESTVVPPAGDKS